MVNGLTGIANVGNTCYLNSVIQILSHTPTLHEILNVSFKNEYTKETIFREEWCDLRNILWCDRPGIVVPNRFIAHLHHISQHRSNTLFSGFQQNDVHEFLIFILETFHLSLSRKINHNISNENDTIYKNYKDSYSDIISLFYGVNVSYIRDMKGSILSKVSEPFSTISIPVGTNPANIYAAIGTYCTPTTLSGDNSYLHPKTNKKVVVTKQTVIESPPTILVVHINRWDYNGGKIETMIDSDTTLDLSGTIIGNPIYKLYGICNHTGNQHGGHYTSNIRKGDEWFNFNDTNITPIKTDDVVTKDAYCFFYYMIK